MALLNYYVYKVYVNIASDEDQSKEAAALADSFAQGLSAEEVEACKAIALAQFTARK